MAFIRQYLSRLNVIRNVTQFFHRSFDNYEDDATTSGITEETNDPESRVIFINRPQPTKFIHNGITTAKYSFATFVPLFLFEQFRRYSNCFFLMIALLQQIPDVSPTGRFTTLTPLIFILSISAIKEIVEDYKRHKADDETNHNKVRVLRNGLWVKEMWKNVRVGDICLLYDNQFLPADVVLLSSSEPQGMAFIETSNLDGETNLKVRQARSETAHIGNGDEVSQLQATVKCEAPNRNLYEFNGNFKETNHMAIPLGLDQMLLRGAVLRNTNWACGVVVYTGHETKLMKNSTKAPLKRSSIDRQTNTHILLLFLGLVLLATSSALGCTLWQDYVGETHWYIGLDAAQNSNYMFNFLTFLILYNNLIPISLQVTAEIVRFFQAKFIALDRDMYHAASDTCAQARTSNLNEELGMIQFVFSDKTGTLTCNHMTFDKCSIAEIIYHMPSANEKYEDTLLFEHLNKKHPSAPVIREFMTMLAVCHTVIPENKYGEIMFHAASPDERALVEGAYAFGFKFISRSPTSVQIDALGSILTYEILKVIDFTSSRKRMSVIVRTPEGTIKLYCKGADSVIYPRLVNGPNNAQYGEPTLAHLEHFATEGLRTLVFAYKNVSEQDYQTWLAKHAEASISIVDREQKIEEVANLIERDLNLLGATAIEDQLQDGVPETIASLLQANIKVWVLTGDKQETAVNIAHSAKLINQRTNLLIINEQTLDGTRNSISRCAMSHPDSSSALIIDGASLQYALRCELRSSFLDLLLLVGAVVCCRVSPMQKAEVVGLISSTGAVTLAIGDGANDVAMIQRASVGVGISGVEGLQAVCAADYSIAQFRYLLRLLLVHGAWNYSRITKLILYSFYKNICLYVIELWFAIYSGWSGQIIFERWTIGFYNVFFTALPPFAIGLFDKICSSDTMLRHPMLYVPSQQGLSFNVRVFWVWALNSLLHSVLLFWLPALLVQNTVWSSGKDGGYLLLGNFIYTYVVIVVCLKSGLSTSSWTCVTHLSIWGSIAFWMLFIVAYSNVYPALTLGSVMLGQEKMFFTSLNMWLGMILIPITVLIPDLFITVLHNSLCKSITEAVRESEIKKRDPGELLAHSQHRPSLAETARLLQNVRNVFSRRSTNANIEMELSHGFAFSQEEGGTVSQSDVIRAYDTSQPHQGSS